MKKIVISVFLLVFLHGMGICFADSGIPNLVGTWTVQIVPSEKVSILAVQTA
jgi:hypothetical protein